MKRKIEATEVFGYHLDGCDKIDIRILNRTINQLDALRVKYFITRYGNYLNVLVKNEDLKIARKIASNVVDDIKYSMFG